MKHTPGPWKVCRSNEDFNGPLFDDEERTYPITSIEAASGSVAKAHDLFEFSEADAKLIAAAPKLAEALNHIIRRLKMDIEDGSRPDQWSMEDLVSKAQEALKGAGLLDTDSNG